MKTAVLLAAATLGIALGAASSQASTSPGIVFAADRAPSVSGEIYRLDPAGNRVYRIDLSNSPYQDLFPVVSPSGKKVAFLRDEGSKAYVYEVSIRGRGLVRVGPALPGLSGAGCEPSLAWQPRGDLLAVGACSGSGGKLWFVRPGKTTLVSTTAIQPMWSPDGRVLAASAPSPRGGTVVRAFSSSGRPLWKASRAFPWSTEWSATDLLAVASTRGVSVYDEAGHLRFTAPGHVSGGPAWSPNGQLVAAVVGGRLGVRSQAGASVVHRSLSGDHALVWADDRHVVAGGFGSCQCQAKRLDTHGGTFSPASNRWFDPLSADRKLAIVTAAQGSSFALGVAPVNGGAGRKYASLPGCYGDGTWMPAASSLQFVGKGRSIVFQSWSVSCDPPFANLYSVTPGSQPRRLTNAKAEETQPALSPDGTQIAYVWAAFTGLSCKGCSDGIRTVNADGTAGRTLTNPQDCTFDDSPTWSPDGATILYSETTCNTPGELFTIPASGGTPHDLGVKGMEPAWGPTRIAYVGSEQSDQGIWTANPDGSNRTRVATSGGHPAWSPDGRLAYVANPSTLVVDSHPVAVQFAKITSLAWSPDGTRLVLTAAITRFDPLDVWTVTTSGTDPVRVTKYYDVFGASWR